MQPNRAPLLCRYHYDPLDRLVASTPATQANTQRFYQKERLTTEIQGAVQHSIMQHGDQLLAQQLHQTGAMETRLLATDQQHSVLNVLDATRPNPLAYTPYGHRPVGNGLLSLLGFNGERPDPVTGCYLLGNGYRPFNPILMRFTGPDSLSPFGEGGVNAYAYCGGDPMNRSDPTGHVGNPFKGLLNLLGRTPRRVRTNRVFDAAVQTPVSVSPPQARSAPAGPPPTYSLEPTESPFSGMSQQELNARPPAYFQSETNLILPAYSPRRNSPPMQFHSTPDLEPPPAYFQNTRLTARQERIQRSIAGREAHLRRILDATRNIPENQLHGTGAWDTRENLVAEISRLRDQM